MARNHKREKGVEIAPCRPGWIGGGLGDSSGLLFDSDYGIFYKFFVMEVPSEKLSSSSVSLEERGWGKKPWSTAGNRLRGQLLTDLGFVTNETLFIGTSVDETKALFRAAQMGKNFAREYKTERIAVYHSGEGAQFISILCHIRHAFAHGRWGASKVGGEIMLYFESGKQRGEEFRVRSRMALKYSTLERWAQIIKKADQA